MEGGSLDLSAITVEAATLSSQLPAVIATVAGALAVVYVVIRGTQIALSVLKGRAG